MTVAKVKITKKCARRYIAENECLKVIRMLKKNKSPRKDGITSEFNQDYWFVIKDEFMQMLEYTAKTEELTNSQYRGIYNIMYS